MTFDINGNTLDGNGAEAVAVETGSDATAGTTLDGWVRMNTFLNTNTSYGAINVFVPDGRGVVEVSGNTIETSLAPLEFDATAPIRVTASTSSSSETADANVSILQNTVFQASDALNPAIHVVQADTVPRPVCLNLRDNDDDVWASGSFTGTDGTCVLPGS